MSEDLDLGTGDDQPVVGITPGRVLGVVAFIIIVIWWIYVFSNGNSVEHPDDFDDDAWTSAAETICADQQAAILELPRATSVETPQERADLIEQATAELETMLAELAALGPPSNTLGAEIVPQWLEDYELYLQDRRNWTAILRTGDDPPFLLSGTDAGVRVTDVLATFAEVNDMPSCAPSGDV